MKYRNELKFILSSQTVEIVKRRIMPVMRRDSNTDGIYTVNNMYLDDYYDTFLNDKQVGSFSRNKYRVRFYNNNLSFIRFENKRKDGEYSYKRSVVLTENEYNLIKKCDFSFADGSDEPILKDVASINRIRRLRPAAEFSYKREAFVYDPCDVRLTFDSSIRTDAFIPEPYSQPPHVMGILLEVKYRDFLPSVISDLIQGLPMTRTEFSKYCFVREREMKH
ncbi:MAG: polyphosphate polymerase domain-containing protein [Oscillospiraceae bacterium]|nr:polyphosphate polymerase domain-containing protein [Oscillospiraceae bacterium]